MIEAQEPDEQSGKYDMDIPDEMQCKDCSKCSQCMQLYGANPLSRVCNFVPHRFNPGG